MITRIKNQNSKNYLRLVVSFLCSFAIVLFIWINLPSSVYADIAVSGSVSSGSAGSGTQLTISHTTPSGSNRLMVVGIGANPHTTGFDVTSVTYNGVSLSGLTPAVLSNDAFSQLFYLKSPDVGTYNVVIKWNNALDSTGELMAAVMTFTGVDQTTPLGTKAGATGTSGTAYVSGISSATGEWIVDAVACETCTSFTAGAGQTERWKLSNNNDWGAGSTKPGAASVSMSWTLGSSDHWAITAVPIKPSGVTSTVNTPTPTPTPGPTTPTPTPTPTPVTYTLYAVDSLRRRIIDPCNRVDKPSQDLTASAGTYSLAGYSFNYRSENIPVSDTLVLIVRSLFAPTRVGIERQDWGNLPVQGKYVTSEAKSPTGVTKKIQLFQSYPQIPAEFFVTSF